MTFGRHNREGLVVGVDHADTRVHWHAPHGGADEQHLPGRDTRHRRVEPAVRRLELGEVLLPDPYGFLRCHIHSGQAHPVSLLPELAKTLQRADLAPSLHVHVGGPLRYVGDLQLLDPLRPVGGVAGLPLFLLISRPGILRRHGRSLLFGGRLHGVRRPDRFLLGIVNADGVVQARDLEDVAVVLAETVGEEPLLLAIDPDEQRDQEPYAATVHVLKALKVQDDRADLTVACLVVGIHQDTFGKGGELALYVYDAHLLVHLAHVHRHLCLGHLDTPLPVYPLYLVALATQRLKRARQVLFVRIDAREVREAGDLEDLDVMVAEAVGQEVALGGAGLAEQAHDEGNPGRVDVVDILEVEDDSLRVSGLCFLVGSVQGFLGEAVDLAVEVEDSPTLRRAHLYLQMTHGHHLPPSARPSRCMISSMVWCSSPVTFISSTMCLMRKNPQPRGLCMPASFALRSGVSAWKEGGPLPSSVILTERSTSETDTSMRTGNSAR